MNKYAVVITWSEMDRAFIAEIPELPGCMADGADRNAALSRVEQVEREWIETARYLHRRIPQARRRTELF